MKEFIEFIDQVELKPGSILAAFDVDEDFFSVHHAKFVCNSIEESYMRTK